jgi:hypothetical protein
MKKMIENEMATAINAGVEAVGAERRRFESLPGRAVRSGMGRYRLDGRTQWKM